MGAPQFEQAGADISGTGTTNTIPRWTGPSTLGDSVITQNSTALVTTGSSSATQTTFRVRTVGTANNAPAFSLYREGVNEHAIWAGSGTIRLGFAIDPAGYTDAQLLTATKMGIDSAGNFGIKQSSPSSFANGIRDLVVGANDGVNNYGITVAGTTQATLAFASGTSGGQAYAGFVQYTHSTSRLDLGAGSSARVGVITTGLDVSTSGYGLKLPATPGNADTQTLDCYQENTGWVPTITFGGASTGMTYTTQAGSWTKIGNLVFVTGRIVLSAKGSSTGVARLANLPVAVGASNASGGGMVGPVANITFGGQLAIYAVASATTLGLAKNTSGGAAVDLTDADFTNTSDITFSCIYRV